MIQYAVLRKPTEPAENFLYGEDLYRAYDEKIEEELQARKTGATVDWRGWSLRPEVRAKRGYS